ncbi:MAG TPA: hypothetical protein VGL22_06375 [Terracidiphilus sp.]|jgi:hypothetical protein
MFLDREQLDTLKRLIEEEYRLDMAAIERLQRRFVSLEGSNSGGREASNGGGRALSTVASTSSTSSYPAPVVETQPAASAVIDLPQERQPDELTGTLRAMFSTQRR